MAKPVYSWLLLVAAFAAVCWISSGPVLFEVVSGGAQEHDGRAIDEIIFAFALLGLGLPIILGVAVWRDAGAGDAWLSGAERAKPRARREGGGPSHVSDDALDQRLGASAELAVDLRAAIEAGDIVPHFQPIVAIADRRLVGFEILSRWRHPRLGPVSPVRFIRLAEDTGQIDALSWGVLRRACEIARRWPPELRVSFNVSPVQFRDADLARRVGAVLREAGFPPERLELEITESAMIADLAHARETFERLRWMGIRMSLDDFGTGFSSFATLARLPFDGLKIDRCFVSQLTSDPRTAKIVAGVVSLAASLDIGVTAEGIETEDACTMLADMNCEFGQGFLFERPLPGDRITAMLRSGDLDVEPSATAGGEVLRACRA